MVEFDSQVEHIFVDEDRKAFCFVEYELYNVGVTMFGSKSESLGSGLYAWIIEQELYDGGMVTFYGVVKGSMVVRGGIDVLDGEKKLYNTCMAIFCGVAKWKIFSGREIHVACVHEDLEEFGVSIACSEADWGVVEKRRVCTVCGDEMCCFG